ncbi:protein sidekick-1 isoform X2 [Stomoxys calcitrans]|uniref:Ig-like domain-containing protein n=1 Tax=Stomoxys calcitrans TaxID=35570 RepID=A0A1I8QBZ1_STOCA|nr:protein sidekick-1 isoform X2 [Stomoxys calcitrans]
MLLASLNFHRLGCLINMQLIFLILLEMRLISGDVSSHYWETPYSQPYFDNSSRREVTSIVGQAALLQCRVRNLGDRAVSWIRKRDLHILTVGILTYTNDQRFQSLHTEGSDEWTLRISSPQPRDSGTYECQVSTEPKISQGFRLNVVVSRAKILGNPELFIKSGSDINLTCLAMQSPIPPSFIYWYKGKRLMNYSQRGGISVITERTTRTSKLLISKATPTDSGNYTCSPSSSDSASVVVHVINGEHPAAMQHGNNSASTIVPYYRRRRGGAHGHHQHHRPVLHGSLSLSETIVGWAMANITSLSSILWSIIDFMLATNCCLVFMGIALSQRLLHTSGRLGQRQVPR